MKAKDMKDKYLLRLERGEEIISSLKEFLAKKDIKAGYFFGIGAISACEIAHYDLSKKKYSTEHHEAPLEVLNMTGNIAMKDNERIIHAHVTLSDKDMRAFGGHLNSATVAATIEIVLIPLYGIVRREYSEEIGLNLLDI